MPALYDIPVRMIDGQMTNLEAYAQNILLIVNVASKCGFTPQYAGLEALYLQYKDRGLRVMGFPCDQFGHQEPGDEAEIKSFCSLTYNVTFPLFAKIEVNGASTHPLYVHLKSAAPGLFWTKSIKWNFTKFLVNKSERTIKRYAPSRKPEALSADIERLLG